MNISELNLNSEFDSYQIRQIYPEDAPKLQALYDASPDYFNLIFGHHAKSHWGELDFKHLPEGKSLDDKFIYGLFEKDILIGALDLIRNYPDPGTWFIGLLLFHPDKRNKGLGKKVFYILCDGLHSIGAYRIRISVAEQNEKALFFWRSLGFTENGRGHEGTSNIIYFDYLL
jgi:RimJ/RimL family protein N-acetyltransferase